MKDTLLVHYEIRQPNTVDMMAIRSMHAQSWRDTYPNDAEGVSREWLEAETASWLVPERIAGSEEALKQIMSDPKQFYRIACVGNEIIGMLHISAEADGSKRMNALYVDKKYHGKGVAQALLLAGREFLGESKVVLEVVSYNERAKAFYRKNGFEEMPGENELFKDRIPNVTMIRKAGVMKLEGVPEEIQ